MTPVPTQPIVIVGTSPRAFALAAALTEAEWEVTVLARPTSLRTPFDGGAASPIVVAELDDRPACERLREEIAALGSRRSGSGLAPAWIAYLAASANDSLADEAYAAGALAVLPARSKVDVVCATVGRLAHRLDAVHEAGRPVIAPKPVLRRHRAESSVRLPDDRVLLVRRGVVAQHTWHEDGTEGLLGLWGPRQAILGHPDDGCCLTLRAHTDLEVEIVDWSMVVERPDIVEMIRQRTLRLESWASMQSRPNVEQRLLGILQWLGEQFGRRVPGGTLIEIRVTHAQLAAAIGATRATVTRILGDLRRRQTVSTRSTAKGERLVLGGGATLVHPLRESVGAGV